MWHDPFAGNRPSLSEDVAGALLAEEIEHAGLHAADHLARMLQDAADAHHRYVEAGHEDVEWPTWYARYVLHLRPEIDW